MRPHCIYFYFTDSARRLYKKHHETSLYIFLFTASPHRRLFYSISDARAPISPERLAWSVRARSAFRAAEAVKYNECYATSLYISILQTHCSGAGARLTSAGLASSGEIGTLAALRLKNRIQCSQKMLKINKFGNDSVVGNK